MNSSILFTKVMFHQQYCHCQWFVFDFLLPLAIAVYELFIQPVLVSLDLVLFVSFD